MTVRIALAQCAPALGAFKRNLAMHLETIERARAAGARLVVFPELSLTGYALGQVAEDVSMSADDPRLTALSALVPQTDVLVGLYEDGQALLCECPGHVSADEGWADIFLDDSQDCEACKKRAR